MGKDKRTSRSGTTKSSRGSTRVSLGNKVPEVHQSPGDLKCSEASAAAAEQAFGLDTTRDGFLDRAARDMGIEEDKAAIVAFENMLPSMDLDCEMREGMTVDDLRKEVKKGRPVIVRMYVESFLDDYLHTVVVTGVDKDKVEIMDPTGGYKDLKMKDFEKWWSNEDRKGIVCKGLKKGGKKNGDGPQKSFVDKCREVGIKPCDWDPELPFPEITDGMPQEEIDERVSETAREKRRKQKIAFAINNQRTLTKKGENETDEEYEKRVESALERIPPGTFSEDPDFVPDLRNYDNFIVFFSGGKDSLCCILNLVDKLKEQGFSDEEIKEKVEVWHHDVSGEIDDPDKIIMDWPVTADYCREVCEALGLNFYISYRKGGFEGELMTFYEPKPAEYVVWDAPEDQDDDPSMLNTGVKAIPHPDNPNLIIMDNENSPGRRTDKEHHRVGFPQKSNNFAQRWCSQTLKIDVYRTALVNQPRFIGKNILTVSGERDEESSARLGMFYFTPDITDSRLRPGEKPGKRKKMRRIDRWRNVKGWSEQQIWDKIKSRKINPHPCYKCGFSRCSCAGCIYGEENEFASYKKIAPKAFDRMVKLEADFGKTIERPDQKKGVKGRYLPELAADGTPFRGSDPDSPQAKQVMKQEYEDPVFVENWEYPEGAFGTPIGPS